MAIDTYNVLPREYVRCEARSRRSYRVGRVRPRRARARPGRDRARPRDVGGAGRRRRGRGRPARQPERLGGLLHGARRRRARPPLARGADRARRHRPRRVRPASRSGAPSPTSTATASGRSRCSGRKLVPSGEDGSLPWEQLARCDGVYFVSGDVAAVRAARRARVLVATSRELPTLQRTGVELDVLVGSGEDAGERFDPGGLEPPPRVVVTTAGALGGWVRPGGPFRAAPLPGPVEDAYGCGDCFAAGLTFALARGAPGGRGGRVRRPLRRRGPHGPRRLCRPAHERGRLGGRRRAVRLGNGPFGPADRVRPHELDRHGAAAVGERHLLHHEREVGPGLGHRDVADLAAARRVPAEEPLARRRRAGADRVLDVRIGARLAELVVQRRADALPRVAGTRRLRSRLSSRRRRRSRRFP